MPSREEVLLHRRYWQRSILIPLWTQQILLQLTGTIFFWFAITIFWDGGPTHGAPVSGSTREQAILCVFFMLYTSLLLATGGEILLYSAHVLKPKGYLVSQLLKTIASVGVWGALVLYPYVIKDPVYSRRQVAIAMEAVFAWLQIPMLSSLVHALLVWREEWKITRELAQVEEENSESPTLVNSSPAIRPQLLETSERTPLISTRIIPNQVRNKTSFLGRSYSSRGSNAV